MSQQDEIAPEIDLHVPARDEFPVRQAWLADPEMMAYNAGWDIDHPGYDRRTGCIDWPESDWKRFEERLAQPPATQGYFYLRERSTGAFLGHAHYLVAASGVAEIGVNIVPAARGKGLGTRALRLLVDTIREHTQARALENEFEDSREASARMHARCGFAPTEKVNSGYGRPTRIWRLRA